MYDISEQCADYIVTYHFLIITSDAILSIEKPHFFVLHLSLLLSI